MHDRGFSLSGARQVHAV